MKNFVRVLILFVPLFLAACSDTTTETQSPEPPKAEATSETVSAIDGKTEAVPTPTPAVAESAEEESLTDSFNLTTDPEDMTTDEQTVFALLLESLGQEFEILLDPTADAFFLIPNPEIAVELTLLLGGELPIENWYGLRDSIGELSSSVSDTLGSPYSILVTNPVNSDLIILVATDGVVISDVLAN